MSDIDALLSELEEASHLPTMEDKWWDGLVDEITADPDKPAYERYFNDPVGFAKDVLGIEVLTDDQVAMMEAVVKYETVIVKSATGVGKTFSLALLAVWLYKTRAMIEEYMASAPPESNLKRLLWAELLSLIESRPKLFEDDSISSLMITRAPKQKIEGVTIPVGSKDEDIEAKFSGKHQKYLVFIFDEADAIPDPVYKGADGCMSGGWVRQILCLNPKKRQGIPYHHIQNQSAHIITMSAFNHPNVITGEDVVPGAVTRKATVRRINEWTMPLPADQEPDSKCFRLPGYLVGVVGTNQAGKEYPPLLPGYRVVTNPEFFYKVLGDYPTIGASLLFPEDAIERARSNWDAYVAMNGEIPPMGIRPIQGLDVADTGADSTCRVFRYGTFVTQPERQPNMDPDAAGDWAIQGHKDTNARRTYVDAIGVGAGIVPKMHRAGIKDAVPVKVNNKVTSFNEDGIFASVRDLAYWEVRKWLMGPGAMLPPDRRLLAAMRIMTYDKPKDAIVVMRKDIMKKLLDRSPDELESLMLTFAPATVWMGGI